MFSVNKLLCFVLLAVSASHAIPFPAASKYQTHRRFIIGRGIEVETYHPATSYKTFGEGKPTPASFATQTLEESTLSIVASELDIAADTISYTNGYTKENEGTSYAYVKQSHEGVDFVNAVANVAYKDDKIVAFGSSFVDASNIAPSDPTVNVDDVIGSIEDQLDGKFNGVKSLSYLSQPDGFVALVHTIQIQNEEDNTWYEALVDAHTGDLLSVIDFVADLSYRVIPIERQDITEGPQELLENPEHTGSSPSGWVASGTTAGNNVIAYKSSQSSVTSESSEGVFDYPYGSNVNPADGSNVDAARVNAFYLINHLHDIWYQYGFTEQAFNFQNDNFNNGGSSNDRVLMSVQDSSGTNNANFATPPDGQSGTCRMYIWTQTPVRRDGSLENDIPVHEFTHGLTNRLTGGGTATCLQVVESRGLGEGWSDAMADWSELKSATIEDFALGSWVTNTDVGIRSFPYSTSTDTNPLRYSDLVDRGSVHDIGEIWGNILHNVLAALLDEHGYSSDAKTNPNGSEGNIVHLHLFLDSLALQPCNPTFVAARDAWIQADANRYGGANKCLLWRVFASRGLGTDAGPSYSDSFDVPDDC